jgi:hypothetical protein
MTYKDNQPTFNVGNRKVVNFKDYLQNKDVEKSKLTKAHLQSKPNSEDQQHPGNTRTEYNPVTHKLTDYSVDEIEDTLDSMDEETNEGLRDDLKDEVSSSFKVDGHLTKYENDIKMDILNHVDKMLDDEVGFLDQLSKLQKGEISQEDVDIKKLMSFGQKFNKDLMDIVRKYNKR